MSQTVSSPAIVSGWSEELRRLPAHDHDYAILFVDKLLAAAVALDASDIHIQPTPAGLEVRMRLDGVLAMLGCFPQGATGHVVSRLKVLAELLTYRTEIAQEGRLRLDGFPREVRLSTFPTIHGERASLRVFRESGQYFRFEELGLPHEVAPALSNATSSTSGLILIVGPAGSGKTTTAYAALRHIVEMSQGQRNILTIEDPVEAVISGITQSQTSAHAGFDLAIGLRALLRQDPDVILIGELRDLATTTGALQAALTGQLVFATFHAGNCLEAIQRLFEMGPEEYAVKAGLRAVLAQRLVRKVCDCGPWSDEPVHFLGLAVERVRVAKGCEKCRGTGYIGRQLLAEWLTPQMSHFQIAEQGLTRSESTQLQQFAGTATLQERGLQAVRDGWTTPAEVRRVLGFA